MKHNTPYLDTIVVAQPHNLSNNCLGAARRRDRRTELATPGAGRSPIIGDVERGHPTMRGLRQRDWQLGALPLHHGSGDGHENIEPCSCPFLSINPMGDGDHERPGEAHRVRVICSWKVSPSEAGSRPMKSKP